MVVLVTQGVQGERERVFSGAYPCWLLCHQRGPHTGAGNSKDVERIAAEVLE